MIRCSDRFVAPGLLCLLLGAVCFSGCVSKSTASAQARAAYLAGQREAVAQLNQEKSDAASPVIPAASNITMIGPVENPVVPWTNGLTLANAILTAVYNSPIDPIMIIIKRSREELQVAPERLLHGGDIPLQPGDIVQFQLPTP